MGTKIFSFARTFSELEHAQDFIKGKLRLQTIEYFRGLEHTDKALRGDAYEGIAGLFQPAHIGELRIAGIVIPPNALGAPITFSPERSRWWHVFCLHTIGFTPDDPEEYESVEAMRKALLLDERCTRLGKHVVFLTAPHVFIKKVHAALKKLRYASQSDLVTYYSELTFSGQFEDDEIPFRKSKRFAYQKEYRIVAKTPKGVGSPLVVDIGDISAITHLTTTEQFNDLIGVSYNEDEE